MSRREADPPRPVPTDAWAFATPRQVKLPPAGIKPEPGSLYPFTYPATEPKVPGLGFAATRDVVAYLRGTQGDDPGGGGPTTSSRSSSNSGWVIPRIRGQREESLAAAPTDYRSDARPGYDPAMNEAAQELKDDEIRALAAYIARL